MSLCGVRSLVVAAGVVVALPAAAGAQDRAWPSFTVMRYADGQSVASATLAGSDSRVVLIVRPRCEPCRHVLARLSRDAHRTGPGRMFVVLSGFEAAEAAALRTLASGLPPTAWYLDPTGSAATALGVQSTPALIGLRGDRIAWVLGGSLYTDAQWEGVVLPWLR